MKLGPFTLGMNNRQPDHALPEGTLRNLVNGRVNNSGTASRRDGMTLTLAGINMSEGFNCPFGVLFREGASIMRFNDDDTSDLLFTGVVGEYCTYHYLNGIVYFSDGIISRKIDSDWNVTNWGMERPDSPVMYGITGGAYGAGVYIGAATFVDINGLESGASDIISVEITDDMAIVFSDIPTTDDPQVVAVRLHLGTANGAIMYQIAELSLGTVSYTQLIGNYDEGKTLETEFISKPSAGRIIRSFNGRIYIADDLGNVWITDPMSYDQMIESENFLQFPKPVTMMEPVSDGIWFAHGDKTEFYAGTDPDSFDPIPIFEYGAVFGTGRSVPNSDNVMWYSNRGAIIAGAGGEIKNIQEENVATHTAVSGATLIKEEDGIKQFIASLTDPTVSNLTAGDFIDAEIIRKG